MAEKKSKQTGAPEQKTRVIRPLNWLRRMFMGASKDLDIFEVEKLESPSKMAVKTFFRRKLAVGAVVVLVALFLLVIIGPAFIPMNLSYYDPLQANIQPTYSMMSVPKGLKNNIRDINGFSNFTLGVSNDNTLYIWGATKDPLTDVDMADFPPQIQEGNVLMAAAGSDHAIAITTDGKVVGWGANNCGQYGDANAEDGYLSMTGALAEFKNGDEYIIPDPSKIQQLVCGYQVTALVVDGQLYMWGNTRACNNLELILAGKTDDVAHVALSNYNAVLLYEDGSMSGGNRLFFRQSGMSSQKGRVSGLTSYLAGKKIVDIVATNNAFVFLLDSGEMITAFATDYHEDVFPTIPAEEKVVDIVAGTRHIVARTDAGKAYAWGYNASGQANVAGDAADAVYTGAMQTYLVDAEDDLCGSTGLRGYLFGTDDKGRDTLTRIIHGGRMTMTIGAVAVIVSSIIAIIVGCISGYFGGWVDMLLMRVTEIFASIPFLPFAMMLSYIIRYFPVEEEQRIFIIMIILGLLSWTGLARMIRAQVLSEREKEFVIAAQSMGVKEGRIAFKHILPNIISVILVTMTLDFAGCLLTESSLSYLGFGVQQPRPTWGNMLNGANNSIVIQNYWWQWVFPAIFLSIATISINIIGDTLRDVLDPKSSREK